MIRDDAQLEVTRQKIARLHELLLEMKRQVPYERYREMAPAFVADLQRMEEEIHDYLLRAPLAPVGG